MPKKELVLKNATIYITYILIVWGFYRFLIQLPEEVEELFVKPLVWLIPILFFVRKEKLNLSSLGFSLKNLFPAVYYSLGLGAIFVMEGIVINYIKHNGFNFGANIGNLPFLTSFGLSFATAFTEEVSFRGYIFNRLWYVLKNEWLANILTSLAWAMIHVPITFFVWKLDLGAALIYLMLTTIFGVASAFVFARTRNILSSILIHVLWEWPIILFR